MLLMLPCFNKKKTTMAKSAEFSFLQLRSKIMARNLSLYFMCPSANLHLQITFWQRRAYEHMCLSAGWFELWNHWRCSRKFRCVHCTPWNSSYSNFQLISNFRGLLLCQKICIHPTSLEVVNRVFWWRFICQEYECNFTCAVYLH